MAPERVVDAAKTHVPILAVVAAIGITAAVLFKLDAIVNAAVTTKLEPMRQRIEELARWNEAVNVSQDKRLDEIAARQKWTSETLQEMAVEMGRLTGETRARRTVPPGR